MQHAQCDSKLMLDNLLSIDLLRLSRATLRQKTSFAHIPTYKPQPNHLINTRASQNSPPHFTRHYLHLQHGQVKEMPQDPEHLLRQSQHERLRPCHHQPPVQRERHQSSRLHGRQSLRIPVTLLQEQQNVDTVGSAGQALLARDEAESTKFPAEV